MDEERSPPYFPQITKGRVTRQSIVRPHTEIGNHEDTHRRRNHIAEDRGLVYRICDPVQGLLFHDLVANRLMTLFPSDIRINIA